MNTETTAAPTDAAPSDAGAGAELTTIARVNAAAAVLKAAAAASPWNAAGLIAGSKVGRADKSRAAVARDLAALAVAGCTDENGVVYPFTRAAYLNLAEGFKIAWQAENAELQADGTAVITERVKELSRYAWKNVWSLTEIGVPKSDTDAAIAKRAERDAKTDSSARTSPETVDGFTTRKTAEQITESLVSKHADATAQINALRNRIKTEISGSDPDYVVIRTMADRIIKIRKA